MILVREDERAIRDTRDADGARRLVAVVREHAVRSRADELVPVYREALERLCELDPTDAQARAERDDVRAEIEKHEQQKR
jgi:hypothetical protein